MRYVSRTPFSRKKTNKNHKITPKQTEKNTEKNTELKEKKEKKETTRRSAERLERAVAWESVEEERTWYLARLLEKEAESLSEK